MAWWSRFICGAGQASQPVRNMEPATGHRGVVVEPSFSHGVTVEEPSLSDPLRTSITAAPTVDTDVSTVAPLPGVRLATPSVSRSESFYGVTVEPSSIRPSITLTDDVGVRVIAPSPMDSPSVRYSYADDPSFFPQTQGGGFARRAFRALKKPFKRKR